MGSSILGEVHDTSILRTELSTRYRSPLGWLQASRLLPPRSGLERSDFVLWPKCEVPLSLNNVCSGREPHDKRKPKVSDPSLEQVCHNSSWSYQPNCRVRPSDAQSPIAARVALMV